MTKYVAPIIVNESQWDESIKFIDSSEPSIVVELDDVATMLTDYLTTKALQEECGETGHDRLGVKECRGEPCYTFCGACDILFCRKCGARL